MTAVYLSLSEKIVSKNNAVNSLVDRSGISKYGSDMGHCTSH